MTQKGQTPLCHYCEVFTSEFGNMGISFYLCRSDTTGSGTGVSPYDHDIWTYNRDFGYAPGIDNDKNHLA